MRKDPGGYGLDPRGEAFRRSIFEPVSARGTAIAIAFGHFLFLSREGDITHFTQVVAVGNGSGASHSVFRWFHS